MDDETFGDPFSTTSTTTTWVQNYNRNIVANSVIDPPKDIYGNPMSMEWQGDPTYDPSKETDMYGNVITKTTTQAPKYLFGKFGEWMDKKGAAAFTQVAKGLNTGFALGNRLVAEKQNRDFQKSYEKNLRNKIFTQPVMPSVSGSRGDYVTNTGAFRPNEYTVNKGMYTSNMPGAIVGTQQFAQFGAEIIPSALDAPVVEFSPIIAPPQQEYITTSETTNPSKQEGNYNLPTAGNYVLPLKEWNVRSGFGRRVAPIPGASTDHNGVDLRAKENTEVFSPFDGTVSKIYYDNKGGKQLIIKHDDGTRSGYAHLNDYKVKVGDKVTKGQFIALTGNTGNSKAAHLHFTFTGVNGKKVDPAEIFGNYTKPSGSSQSDGGKAPSGSIAVTHNNPGNIHYGKFTSQWGATKGSLDAGSTGNVAMFKTLEDGWDAFKKLIKGKGYSDLSLLDARKKWVTGDENKDTPSAALIVKEMGLDANTKVKDLTPEQLIKYSSLFVKYEDKKMYKKMKDLKYFEEGGEVNYNEGEEYDLTEDQIRQILEQGGEIEFI
jgi:murein DD-endopeptidase MepM/ murein hydrolase activator NlpD